MSTERLLAWLGGTGAALLVIASVVAVRRGCRQRMYSIDEVHAHLTAKIEARRAELAAGKQAKD